MLRWFKSMTWEEITANSDYKAVRDFAQNFVPMEGKSYGWINEHAREQFRDVTDTISDLDRKADSMIRYLAPGTGLVSVVAGVIASNGNYQGIALIMGAGVALIVGAMALAAFAVLPHQQCLLPSVKDAFTAANHFDSEEHAKAYWATCIQKAIEAKSIVAEIKARRIELSYKLFAIALAWLLIVTPIVFLA